MATFQQVILTALKNGRMTLSSVNRNVIEIASSTKKKSAFVKVAVTDDLAKGLLHRERVAFILHADGDVLDEIVRQLDEKEAEPGMSNPYVDGEVSA